MIPIVDISSHVKGGTGRADRSGNAVEDPGAALGETRSAEAKETARLLHDAICEHGFCFLANHGVPQKALDDVLSASKCFFELPVATKQKYARGEETNHGWVATERERLNPNRPVADLKEAFNFSPCEDGTWPTTEVPNMRSSFDDIFRHCNQLLLRVLDLLGLALEFEDPSFLCKCHQLVGKKGNYTSLRSLYYPVASTLKEGQIQCGEHSDYGSITLLFQDDTGGLQVLGKDGEYHDVTPVPGAVLVNIGDLLQRWTADKYPSTKHRVIVPRKAAEEGRARQSVVFFAHPDDDTLITCLDNSNTYPPITSYDYLMQRFQATY